MDELKIQVLNAVRNFPIGSIPASRLELLGKAGVVSFLSRFQEQFSSIDNVDEIEDMVEAYLSSVLELQEGEQLPNLTQAERILGLSNGFVQDFGKVQYIKENNPNYNRTYDIIAAGLGLSVDAPRSSR